MYAMYAMYATTRGRLYMRMHNSALNVEGIQYIPLNAYSDVNLSSVILFFR